MSMDSAGLRKPEETQFELCRGAIERDLSVASVFRKSRAPNGCRRPRRISVIKTIFHQIMGHGRPCLENLILGRETLPSDERVQPESPGIGQRPHNDTNCRGPISFSHRFVHKILGFPHRRDSRHDG